MVQNKDSYVIIWQTDVAYGVDGPFDKYATALHEYDKKKYNKEYRHVDLATVQPIEPTNRLRYLATKWTKNFWGYPEISQSLFESEQDAMSWIGQCPKFKVKCLFEEDAISWVEKNGS
jgi:hypothetical protein